ncbi:mycofactocin system transcriptional regulator [Geodermatophilus bullaregiensis]|uniref:acyl-CoA-like ligand-binding transcription factor n=1 Tax=Geodermatophilus bullaregiensis TaxID=1564160 RepID=UPI001959DBE0|nr:TetR family transcriptional regulator [Geodermatophilus bullaregiensis]MBM7806437.1 mycofactocin system transcriptional regulator [Geodermatophilus bullaregiensis]
MSTSTLPAVPGDGHGTVPDTARPLPRALGGVRAGTRARIEQAALELFTAAGFEQVTIEDIAAAAGTSRRTFFRQVGSKADAVWGDFAGHVARLAGLLAAAGDDVPVLPAVFGAYVEVNDYAAADLPVLRQRMRLILTEPALLAHSQVRCADVDRVVAGYVARRCGEDPAALLPRLVATATRAAATTAFEVWLGDQRADLSDALRTAFGQLAEGFPQLRARD